MKPTSSHFNYESIFDQFILSGDYRRYWAEQSLFDSRGEFNEFRSLRIHGSRQSGKTTALLKQLTKHPGIQVKLFYPGLTEVEHFELKSEHLFHEREFTQIKVEELKDIEVLLIDDSSRAGDPKSVYDEVVKLWCGDRDQFHPNFSIIMIE